MYSLPGLFRKSISRNKQEVWEGVGGCAFIYLSWFHLTVRKLQFLFFLTKKFNLAFVEDPGGYPFRSQGYSFQMPQVTQGHFLISLKEKTCLRSHVSGHFY